VPLAPDHARAHTLIAAASAACTLQGDALLQLSRLLSSYQGRNMSTVFANQYPVWQVRGQRDWCGEAGGQRCSLVWMQRAPCVQHVLLLFCLQAGSGQSFTVDAKIRIPPNQVVVYRCAHGGRWHVRQHSRRVLL
jgi:hypothetical protein